MKTFFTYAGIGLLASLMASCTGDFEKINTPPTTVTTVSPELLFPNVLLGGTLREYGQRQNTTFGSWVQHWASGPIVPTSRYIGGSEDALWREHYGLIRDIVQIRKELAGMENDPEGRSRLAMASIWEVSLYQGLTDMFGDVPFSEVTRSATQISSTPRYDRQEDIYPALIARVDEALAALTDGDRSYGTADLFYGGDLAKWRKFGNSLKLRLGMRIRYANADLAKKTVEEAMASPYGLLAGNADNAAIATNNGRNETLNPMLGQYETGSADLRYLANTLVEQLKTYSDPRLPLLAEPVMVNGNPEYHGIGVALTDNELAALIRDNYSTANLSTWFNRNFDPIPVYAMTYSDVCFYKAEAALLGWGASATDAHGFFLDGVRAALALLPYNSIPTTDIADYETNVLDFSGLSDEAKMEKIATQKWLHLFGRNMEAFAEWRRTGYPKLTAGPYPGSTNGSIPRRAIYSADDASMNADNYREAVARMSDGDTFLSKVWWDK